MISASAKTALDQIFARAARTSLALSAADSVSVVADADVPPPADGAIIVLTVASFRFRLLTLFHLGNDRAVADYYGRGDATRELADTFGEFGNLCCGAMNRELGRHFAHTGMSTPYRLNGRCLAFIDQLKPTHVAPQRITINDTLTLGASLCWCAYAPIDFGAGADAADESGGFGETTGEIEFF